MAHKRIDELMDWGIADRFVVLVLSGPFEAGPQNDVIIPFFLQGQAVKVVALTSKESSGPVIIDIQKTTMENVGGEWETIATLELEGGVASVELQPVNVNKGDCFRAFMSNTVPDLDSITVTIGIKEKIGVI